MKLILARHTWGLDGDQATQFARSKSLGYSAIEGYLLWQTPEQLAAFRTMVQSLGMQFIAQVFTKWDEKSDDNSPAAHLASLERQVRSAQDFPARFVNAHSGSDLWTVDEALRFYEGALDLERRCGIAISHELHRGRFFMNPRDTAAVLRRLPQLKITADFSHWVNVCERMLDDCQEAITLVADSAWHIHARVGFEEGPQVNDPRAPEWAHAVACHESWWDQVWNSQQRRGFTETTLTPEFGPPGYMPTLPYTRQPLANLAEICDWQAARQAQRFAARA